MGGTTLSFVIDGEPCPTAAFARMIADAEAKLVEEAERYPGERVDRWWLDDKDRAFTVVDHPHLSVAQCEQGAMWRLDIDTDDKWGPWFAVGVGETSVRTVERVWESDSHPVGTLRYDNEGRPMAEPQAPGGERRMIESVWPRVGGIDLMVSAQVQVSFVVEVHTPVGAPTGWCFYGWVNT